MIKKSDRSCRSYRVHASLFTKRLRELVKKHVGTLCIAEVVFHMLSKCFSAVFFKVNFTFIRNFPLEYAFFPRDVERNDMDASKPVARHFNLPNHSKQHTTVCGLSLHLRSSESRKTLEQKFIFQIGTLNSHGINERFSFN